MKHTIWNSQVDVEDYKDFLSEQHPNVVDDYEKQELVNELNTTYLDDERMNLDIKLDNDVLVLGNLGLWNGNVPAYKYLSGNVNEALSASCDDEVYVYVDAYNLVVDGIHHDGCNHYVVRELKPGVPHDNPLTRAIVNGKFPTSSQISRYTRSLRPVVAKVYGW